MEPVSVYCCGDIIKCIQSINECEICGTEYDQDGNKLSDAEWELDNFYNCGVSTATGFEKHV